MIAVQRIDQRWASCGGVPRHIEQYCQHYRIGLLSQGIA